MDKSVLTRTSKRAQATADQASRQLRDEGLFGRGDVGMRARDCRSCARLGAREFGYAARRTYRWWRPLTWVEDLLNALCAFLRGVHDDDVDAFTQLVAWSLRQPDGETFTGVGKMGS